jgi:hypothetical protein
MSETFSWYETLQAVLELFYHGNTEVMLLLDSHFEISLHLLREWASKLDHCRI